MGDDPDRSKCQRGTVDRVVFQSPDREFAVVRIVPEGGSEPFLAAGRFPLDPVVGEELTLEGAFEMHPRHGRRWRISKVYRRPPASLEGLRRYLGSGRLRGIGKKLADRVVAHFGLGTLDVLESHPERLLEVPGVGKKKVSQLQSTLAADRDQRSTLVFLQGLGLGPGQAERLARALGPQAADQVRENPFRLIGTVKQVGFATADRLALSLGHAPDSPMRLRAALRYGLDAAAREGHVAATVSEVLDRAATLISVPRAQFLEPLREAVRVGDLRALTRTSGEPLVYIPSLAAAEEEVAARLLIIDAAPWPTASAPSRLRFDDGGVVSTEEQTRAVATLRAAKVALLTGGPGVGKTTVLRALVAAFESDGYTVALASPTGRAARRLEEATGRPAATLHRLFGLMPDTSGPAGRAPDQFQVLVIDECSMVDLPLLQRVLRCVDDTTVLTFVGDPDQLPSVGPGSVLRDLLASERFPVVRLTKVHRQRDGGLLLENAHRIRRGELPKMPPEGELSDFHWVERDEPERAAELIERLFFERIPARYGLDPIREIQILSPMHRGTAGVEALNARIQIRRFADAPRLQHRNRAFHVGDRVLMTRNDYDKDLMNGDMGWVAVLDGAGLAVEFEGRSVRFSPGELDDLEIAYALTVHKAQGAEFPAVIVPVLTEHRLMLRRSVLYTACTRARRLLVLVGTSFALELAVRDASELVRRSELEGRLRGKEFGSLAPEQISVASFSISS